MARASIIRILIAGFAVGGLLAGCAAANQQPNSGSDAHDPPGTSPSPTSTRFAPVKSGSTDADTGALADALIAQVTQLPPRTVAAEKAPIAELADPLSTFGCAEVQRTVFWVASGWSPEQLADWIRAHPLKGWSNIPGNADSLNKPVVRQMQITKGPAGAPEKLLSFRLVPLDETVASGRVGVAVEAEVTPANACLHPVDGNGGTGNK